MDNEEIDKSKRDEEIVTVFYDGDTPLDYRGYRYHPNDPKTIQISRQELKSLELQGAKFIVKGK